MAQGMTKEVQDYCVYTTTSANQQAQILCHQEYVQRAYLEDGTELDVSGSNALTYRFPNAGEHKVWIELKNNVTDFMTFFFACDKLTSIPANFFANNPDATNFRECFAYCSGLTGKCPVDNDGTPIYNRSGNGKEGYAIVTSYSRCFFGCTKMSDYNSIPDDWKN